MILHHIQTSPSNDNALRCCLKYIAKNDSIVLSADGVNAILLAQWAKALEPFRLMLLNHDVKARGLETFTQNYQLIDYNDFVNQTLIHDKIITW